MKRSSGFNKNLSIDNHENDISINENDSVVKNLSILSGEEENTVKEFMKTYHGDKLFEVLGINENKENRSPRFGYLCFEKCDSEYRSKNIDFFSTLDSFPIDKEIPITLISDDGSMGYYSLLMFEDPSGKKYIIPTPVFFDVLMSKPNSNFSSDNFSDDDQGKKKVIGYLKEYYNLDVSNEIIKKEWEAIKIDDLKKQYDKINLEKRHNIVDVSFESDVKGWLKELNLSGSDYEILSAKILKYKNAYDLILALNEGSFSDQEYGILQNFFNSFLKKYTHYEDIVPEETNRNRFGYGLLFVWNGEQWVVYERHDAWLTQGLSSNSLKQIQRNTKTFQRDVLVDDSKWETVF